jgi:hypothetical protein
MPYLGDYTGAPSQSPSGEKSPFLRDSATPGAFGVQVDEAQQQLGQQISKSGDVLQRYGDQIQNDYLTAASSNVENNFQLDIAPRTAQHNQLTGAAAIADAGPYQQFLQDAKAKALAGSPNGAVTRLVAPHLDRIATSFTVASMNHVAAQTKQYAINETTSRAGIAANQGAMADTDEEFDQALKANEAAVRDQSRVQGWDPDTTNLKVMEGQAVVRGGKLTAMSSTGQSDKAMLLYNKWAKEGTMYDPSSTIHDHIYNDQVKEFATRNANDQVSGDYNTNLRKTENPSGEITAGPGNTSATGLFQVTRGTWATTANKHPELGLTPEGRTGTGIPLSKAIEQQTAEQNARAADQEEILKEKGFPVTQKNKYMMHLMGDAGGPSFLQKLQDDPDANAATAFPTEASTNPSIFYNPDGTPRSLKQAYNFATRNFGSGQLTAFSTEKQVGQMEQDARAKAEEKFPGDANAADTASRSIRSKYNDQLYDFNQSKNANLTIMRDIAFADRDHPPSMADVMQDPQFSAAAKNILAIPGGQAIVSAFEKGLMDARREPPLTPERTQLLQDLEGMRQGQPEQFVKQDVESLDIGWREKVQIRKQQQAMKDVAAGDPAFGAAVAHLQDTGALASVGLHKPAPRTSNPNWTNFQGQLASMMKGYMTQHPGQVPGNKEIDDMAATIFANRANSGWFGSNVGRIPEFKGDVPTDRAAAIKADIDRRDGPGAADRAIARDPMLLRKAYSYQLYQENLRKQQREDRAAAAGTVTP